MPNTSSQYTTSCATQGGRESFVREEDQRQTQPYVTAWALPPWILQSSTCSLNASFLPRETSLRISTWTSNTSGGKKSCNTFSTSMVVTAPRWWPPSHNFITRVRSG